MIFSFTYHTYGLAQEGTPGLWC